MVQRRLSRRRYSKGKYVLSFSERSGCAFPYGEMVIEPGTGLWVHKSENDGKYNRRDVYLDPIVPPDAQQLQHQYGPPAEANAQLENTFWLSASSDTEEPLYVDGRKQDTLNTQDIV